MPEANDWNQGIIDEFRANEGRVGGMFEGASMILVHHVGRTSGKEYVTPLVYQPGQNGDGALYIFGSKGGAPTHPEWYRNLVAAGQATVEVSTDSFPVTVTEVIGAERDRIYAEQVKIAPGFGDYEKKTAGIRTIPVLRLTRG
ncbi:MAG TPA: nitroreductase family deazaflavin-dependent oxidoreductase [Trebonia sp.]|nr:nitroreductase family deazaflavin-dependent oxidoreductase [Trebonia sp.]